MMVLRKSQAQMDVEVIEVIQVIPLNRRLITQAVCCLITQPVEGICNCDEYGESEVRTCGLVWAIWMLQWKLPFWEVCQGRRGCLRLAAYKGLSSHFCSFSSSLPSLDLVSSLNAPFEISLSIGRNSNDTINHD
jgi:hypothetical protein